MRFGNKERNAVQQYPGPLNAALYMFSNSFLIFFPTFF